MQPSLEARLLDDYPARPRIARIGGLDIPIVDVGTGPTLVLVHGLGADMSDFREIVPVLADSFRTVSMDLPGFGLASRPETGYDMGSFATLLEGVLVESDASPAVVVGTSMGGQIALRFALRCPERLVALVVADCGGTWEALDGQRELALRMHRPEVLLASTGDALRRQLRRVFHEPDRWLERYAAHRDALLTSDEGPAVARAVHRSVEGVYDGLLTDEELACVTVPTLVCWGAHDRVIGPEEGRRLAERIPGARFVTIPGAGHVPWLERPGPMVEEILAFLGGLAPGR